MERSEEAIDVARPLEHVLEDDEIIARFDEGASDDGPIHVAESTGHHSVDTRHDKALQAISVNARAIGDKRS